MSAGKESLLDARHQEGEWTRFDYPHGESIWQRACPDCDQGLLYAPVRFCPGCGGSGYLATEERPT